MTKVPLDLRIGPLVSEIVLAVREDLLRTVCR